MNRWGSSGPPEEAYSRITYPDRFLPLHAAATRLLEALQREYAVSVAEASVQDAPGVELLRPGVTLTPAQPNSAPITFFWTAFPGVLLHCGRCTTAVFPACGCDACDENAPEEIERLTWTVECVAQGRFDERVSVSWRGRVSARWELWSESARVAALGESRCHGPLPERGQKLRLEWQPWPQRPAA
jgi:hypothetical protein